MTETTQVAPKDIRVGVKAKLFGMIIGTAMLALLAACLTFVLYDRKSFAASKRATLTVLTDAVANSAFGPVAFQDEESAKYVLKTVGSESTALSAAIYLDDGKMLAKWTRPGHEATLPNTLKGPGHKAPPGDMAVLRPIAKDENSVGKILVIFSQRDIELRTQKFMKLAGQVLAGAILLATLLVLIVHRTFTGPLLRLSEAAARVQHEGRFDIRVEPTSRDEFGVLTTAFNAMLQAVEHRDHELAEHRQGLERTVQERTRDLDKKNQAMRLVLDTVDQGLVTLDLSGTMEAERSAQFDKWFTDAATCTHFARAIEANVPGFYDRFDISFEQLADGFMPEDIALAQLPRLMVDSAGRSYQLDYRPIYEGATLSRVLSIVTDVTDHLARERAEREQRQVISMFENIAKDRAGFVEFLTDTDAMVKQIVSSDYEDRAEAMRILHTIKGNTAIFELHSIAQTCHRIEEHCAEGESLPSSDARRELAEAWNIVAARARELLGDVENSLVIELADYDEVLKATRAISPSSRLTKMIERLSYEPVQPKLNRYGTQMATLAARLGVENFRFVGNANGVRLPEGWGWLWAVAPHLLRNAVDHGLSNANGTEAPVLKVTTTANETHLVLEVRDNGAGIDWDKLRASAEKKGLPHATKADLARALFADEVSTKTEATDVSGRGVGMAAVLGEVRARGGRVEVASERGKGTVFTLTIPFRDNPVSANLASIHARSLLPPNIGVLDTALAKSS